jgi:ketosteroid isomerase-like protein
MSTQGFDHTARGGLPTLPRRSFLQFGGTGLALGAVLARGGILNEKGDQSMRVQRRRNEEVVRRLLHTIETGSTSAIWSFFADDGVVEFPFTGARYTDFASFDAALAPFFAALEGFTYTDPVFEPLDDPTGLIAKYKAHATVNFTGKTYDQTYITEVHLRHGKVTSWAEYFDTAVLNEAFTP